MIDSSRPAVAGNHHAADRFDMNQSAFRSLAEDLRAAAAAYYQGDGSQVLDDATYDAGIRRLRASAEESGWTDADDLLNEVAGGQAGGDVPHEVPMLSLDNAMDDDEMRAFFDRVAAKTGVPEDQLTWVVEPKLDGMALSVRYVDGLLADIVTRGNGLVGESVATVARHAAGIPGQVRGEASFTVVGEPDGSATPFRKGGVKRPRHLSSQRPPGWPVG